MGRPAEATETESMRNLAYVVSSANDNIQALQKTIKQQEQELSTRADHAAALQRNYETLARIRQADQKEFLILKTQQASEREQLVAAREQLAAERRRTGELEVTLQQSAAAQAELQSLQLQLSEATRERAEQAAEAERARGGAAELEESNKILKMNIDKLSRAQQEMLIRSRRADDMLRGLEADKDAAERQQAHVSSRASVQERQLKTFLQANEALEADLRKQLARVQQLERRKLEQEAEQQTIEAYYQARLEEMQAQYDKLLSEIDDAKRAAQEQVYRAFHDDAPIAQGGVAVVPPAGAGAAAAKGAAADGDGTGDAPGSARGGRVRPSPTKK